VKTDKKFSKENSLKIDRDKNLEGMDLCWKASTKFFLNIVDHTFWKIQISAVSIIILVLNDIKNIILERNFDYIIEAFYIYAFCALTFELTIKFFFTKNYKFSFFFWLDLFAILSLIPIISYFGEVIFNPNGHDYEDEHSKIMLIVINFLAISGVTRASLYGTK
jgi:hypothetical protein